MVSTRDRLKQTKEKLVSLLKIHRKPNSTKNDDLEMSDPNEKLTILETTVSTLTSNVGELVEQLRLTNLTKASTSVERQGRSKKKGVMEMDGDEDVPIKIDEGLLHGVRSSYSFNKLMREESMQSSYISQEISLLILVSAVRKEMADELIEKPAVASKYLLFRFISASILKWPYSSVFFFCWAIVNLTLIDLPGLLKVAVEGQSDNIVMDIENIVFSYIEKISCEVDPKVLSFSAFKLSGERTFGVLTKIDLMDKGTDAVEILKGKSFRLQFPWIGVVNRSQVDINKSVDIIAAQRREREYFANTPEYKHLAHKMGSEHLGRILSKGKLYMVMDWRLVVFLNKYTRNILMGPPEQGYRRLIESSLVTIRGHAEAAVDTVHAILMELVHKAISETE
ncbi:hypothetical protein GIB67_039781 [Kingdonia uniflora]|uniref:Dynamin GTPase domain-containing protein n=1 Tax=Kingdonia uniflora TaxID=39325 RepID=A0A7J7MQE5_9MAGN|nr:hypothetical protein GIB67_039781 [Kingdonia uniflora]